jgi:DNA mismatch repair protein MutH
MNPPHTSPDSPDDLLNRAKSIAGLTLGDLAQMANIVVPENFKKHKGWSGQLLELWLGASAGSKPTQDFPELGVELKTLPVSLDGKPLETTYVCFAPLTTMHGWQWKTSNVRNKLQKVMWIPIQGERNIPPAHRVVGTGFFWTPSPQQEQQLQRDWEELMELIMLGGIESVTAEHGEVLQLRPKAADGSVVTEAFGSDGGIVKTRPRGFYLRKSFTHQILQDQFNIC